MMGKVLVEWNEAHEEIFLQMNEMWMEILDLGKNMDHLLNSNSDEIGPSHGHANSTVGDPPWFALLKVFSFLCSGFGFGFSTSNGASTLMIVAIVLGVNGAIVVTFYKKSYFVKGLRFFFLNF